MRDRREVVHALFWDSWWRGANGAYGVAPAAQSTLFGTGQVNIGIGNKISAGIFPDNNVFKILGMRNYLLFNRSVGPSAVGGNVDDLLMMHQAVSECFYKLDMSQKTEFQAPAWYLPAGGGPDGDIGSATDRQLLNNGVPSARAALQFAKPYTVSPLQLFTVECQESVNGASSIITDLNNLTGGITANSVGVEGVFVRAAL
jgi:hypothetical protein